MCNIIYIHTTYTPTRIARMPRWREISFSIAAQSRGMDGCFSGLDGFLPTTATRRAPTAVIASLARMAQ